VADAQEKDQKTEEATPRRKEEARSEGQVALSAESVAAAMLCAGVAALLLGGGVVAEAAGGFITKIVRSLPDLGQMDLTAGDVATLLSDNVKEVMGVVLAVFLPVIAVGALASYAQVGMQIAPKAVQFDPGKVNPAQGYKRLFSMRAVVRTGLSLAKVLLITATMMITAWLQIPDIVAVAGSELGPLLAALTRVALKSTAATLVVVAVLALIDYAYQRFQHGRDLRMSKQEVKEESKMTEGDPHVKARIRQIQREMSMRRMMDDVPKATVVVTNPTHFAVALQYERDADGAPTTNAPVVVAKGVDAIAQRIKEVARESGVICHEDVPLARALHARTQIGEEIPEDLFAAVAAVLSHVYRLEGIAA
jgi:flagellar biosynthetic protein FlhB